MMKTPEEIKQELNHLALHFWGRNAEDTCRDAIRYIRYLEERQLRWFSLKERLPYDGQKVVLINAKHPHITYEGIYHHDKTPGKIVLFDIKVGQATHWMPKPEPPMEG